MKITCQNHDIRQDKWSKKQTLTSYYNKRSTVNNRFAFIPLRVRLRSWQPLASHSLLQCPKKLSSAKNSPLWLLLELLLLPLMLLSILLKPPGLIPLSIGITDATFHTSFVAFAFNVATPLNAAPQTKDIQFRIWSIVKKHPELLNNNASPWFSNKV